MGVLDLPLAAGRVDSASVGVDRLIRALQARRQARRLADNVVLSSLSRSLQAADYDDAGCNSDPGLQRKR